MKISLRVWILIFALFLALLAIAPWKALESGIIIKSVDLNSTALSSGLKQGMVIIQVNDNQIKNLEDYTKSMSEIFTNNQAKETKVIIKTRDNEFILFTDKAPEIDVANIPKTNIKTGLDLSGGARALVKPENISLSSSDLSQLIAVTEERLNVFGISDVSIRPVKDLQGNNYMMVEIAGATPADLKDLISKQGKFEAKIGDEIVFAGGNKDIASVCRNDASCSGIYACEPSQEGYYCSFRFSVFLSEAAAKRHADITSKLAINSTLGGKYLEKKLDLYVDDSLLDSLLISADLKGQVATQISIQGSGTGSTQQDAYNAAQKSMNKLQTILITGSLPYKLEIVKLDTISPTLGKQFTKNIIFLAAIAFIAVSVILLLKYRRIKITFSVILTMFSEAFITLGIAALIRWNLDAPSIAGIIVGIGTGVNDQIVIISESVSNLKLSISERIKKALFIIFGAFFTIIAAMLPLFWVGAGMLRGFALTTILTVTAGILITRPAFADILKRISS